MRLTTHDISDFDEDCECTRNGYILRIFANVTFFYFNFIFFNILII